MKSSLLLLLALLAGIQNNLAQQAVARITQVANSQSWYQEQAELWQQQIKQTPTDADAWLNYYFAARYANFTRTEGASKNFDLEAITAEANRKAPGTYSAEYLLYMQKLGSMDAFPHLLKAYELRPDWSELYHDMVGYYVLTDNKYKAAEFCKKWFESGDYSPGLLKWNYNMLMSVENNAILLSWGDNDTYPVWLLQYSQNIRPDVTLLNLNLLAGYSEYRQSAFEQAGIPIPADKQLEPPNQAIPFLVNYLPQHCSRPLYFGCGIPENLYDSLSGKLYTTGLAFKYSPVSFDNLALLRRNYEQRFLKDYLNIELEPDNSASVVADMNCNYLPPFLRLYQHYESAGETNQAEALRTQILHIAEKSDRTDAVLPYLSLTKPSNNIASSITPRDLDKGMKKIKGNLYADEAELSNQKYEQFLIDLLRNKEYEKLDRCKNTRTDWRTLAPEKFRQLPDDKLFHNGHPDDPNAPVQNIEYEAARQYCAWITEVYNNSTDKKKQFKKVRFRLPTQEEWELAARGGMPETTAYSWGGQFVRNSKGCYLGNFNVDFVEPCPDCPLSGASNDGGFFTVPVTSYYPNNYGLYSVHGNVAEMINEKGAAMGGSWNDPPEACRANSKQNYTTPSPSIGFRVFMEIIEE